MTSPPTVSLSEQMLRRRPVIGARGRAWRRRPPETDDRHIPADDVRCRRHRRHRHLLRPAGRGTDGGPLGRCLVHHRGHRGRLGGALLCRDGIGGTGFRVDVLVCVHHARRVRRDGRGGMPAARIRRLHRGGGRRLEPISEQAVRQPLQRVGSCRDQITAAPWDEVAEGHAQGWINLPAVVLVVLCALLLIRGASESAVVNTVMVRHQAGRARPVRRSSRSPPSTPTISRTSRRSASRQSVPRQGTIFFSYHRPRRGIHCGRRGQGPAEDHAARHHRGAADRDHRLRPRRHRRGRRPEVGGCSKVSRPGSRQILDDVTGAPGGAPCSPRAR